MSMFDFDLQRFADEESSVEVAEEPVEAQQDVAANSDVQDEPDAGNEPEEEKPEIPAELAGLDEGIAREAMEEARRQAKEAEQPEDQPEQQREEIPQSIPYSRFKQKVDEVTKLKEEIEALKAAQPQASQEKLQAQPAAQAPIPQPVQPQKMPPQFTLDDANVAAIKKAIQDEAAGMAQLTKEDIESLDYMEDSDPRKMRWQYAQEFARAKIINEITQARQQQFLEAQRFLAEHRASVEDYNEFAERETKEPDFEAVRSYAINDFFSALPRAEQPVIAGAYQRIEQQTASPQDIYLIKSYYAQAKAAYRAAQQPAASKPKKQKMEQAKTFPRSQQVRGTSSPDGGVTEAQLRTMLNETPWEKIPKQYQEMLLTGKIK